MSKKINLRGFRSNRLLVVTPAQNIGTNTSWWCECNCGEWVIVRSDSIKQKRTESCGCLNREKISKRFLKHGHTSKYKQTIEYVSWNNMIVRCTKQNNKRYEDYGGRGIFVCGRWKKSFENFLKDMGLKPDSKYTIDRIDNNGSYGPWNCHWITQKEQCRLCGKRKQGSKQKRKQKDK